jgi:hypothetical protein
MPRSATLHFGWPDFCRAGFIPPIRGCAHVPSNSVRAQTRDGECGGINPALRVRSSETRLVEGVASDGR